MVFQNSLTRYVLRQPTDRCEELTTRVQHPGGDEVIVAEAGLFPQKVVAVSRQMLNLLSGKDATEAFEDVGHSDEARELLKDMFVGDFEGSSVRFSYFHVIEVLTVILR